MKCLFLDEAGNFDFSEKGTPFLMVCATLLDINVADYCTWAVWRQIVSQDARPMEALGNPIVHLAVIGEG